MLIRGESRGSRRRLGPWRALFNPGGKIVQDIVYEVGKAHGFEPLRPWFAALYEVLLGQAQGPRFGSFAALFGCVETAAMIRSALNGEFLK